MHCWNGAWYAGVMWLSVLLGVVVVGTIAWLIARSVAGRNAVNSPEQILERRYASGDIGRQEYERRLADLRR